MKCSKCGTENLQNSNFCSKCGNILNNNVTTNNVENIETLKHRKKPEVSGFMSNLEQ